MIWMGSCTGLAERGQRERSGSPGGSKWLSAKTADWQEVWLRVGDVGACEWLRGFGILTNETLSPYHIALDWPVLLVAVSRIPNFLP
jgi:hypothetical protein